MNDAVQDLVNGLAGRNDLADLIGKFLARDLIFFAVPLMLALWFLPIRRDRPLNQRLALLACGAAVIALALGALAGQVYYQDRPFVDDQSTRLLISHGADNGFPSDHATVAFALAGAFLVHRRTLGIVLLAAALLLGLARVYVGVHWPGDVLAAAVIGVAVGLTVASAERFLRPAQAYVSRILPGVLVAAPD